MKALFIGLGSIGTRHLQNLTALCEKKGIPLQADALRSGSRPLRPGAAELLAWVRGNGDTYRFLTNNSSRGVDAGLEKMHRLGIPAKREEFLTAVEATIAYLRHNRSPADVYYALGTASFRRQLAEAVLADWTGGTVLLLDTAGESTGVDARLDGAEAVLTQAGVPVLRQTAAPDRLATGLQLLSSVKEAAAIMAFEPYATEQTIRAVEAGGLGQLIYGVGVSTYVVGALERGSMTAVAAWSDYAAGYLAAEGAIRLARGEQYAAEALPFTIVRGEDIYEPDNQKLLFPVTS